MSDYIQDLPSGTEWLLFDNEPEPRPIPCQHCGQSSRWQWTEWGVFVCHHGRPEYELVRYKVGVAVKSLVGRQVRVERDVVRDLSEQ